MWLARLDGERRDEKVVAITFAPPRAIPPPRAERLPASSNPRPSFSDQSKGTHFGLLH